MSIVTFKAVRDFSPRKTAFNGRKSFTEAETAVLDRCGHVCHYCGSPDLLTMDHIIPRSKGGSDCASNLLSACQSCNASRGNKDYDEFVEWRQGEVAAFVAMQMALDCL